ncbi:hypothetical protein L915_21169 [Phytophthora nicotianae]|uniref:Uncharacterized protein n=2 Tax=Phytophthora nicotianae TaxID=4792 RepID=W2FLF9_PHYNI|nr:hypothetical protein L915_21169 [Phytophthora nicotianae]ETO59937.1 hypothetical protein F444_21798 [Phytophthora nicotianae P1976]
MGVPEGRGRSYGGRFKRERGESVLVVSDVYGFKNCSHRDQWNDVGRIRVSHPRTWRRKPNGGLEHKISRSSVGAIRWTVMRRAFAIDRFETVADESVTKPEFRQMIVEAKYNHASISLPTRLRPMDTMRQSFTTNRSKMSWSVEKTIHSFQLAICLT